MSRGIRSISIVRLAGLAALAGMVSACAQATRAGPGAAPGMYPLVIDGVVVRVPEATTLLDALQRTATGLRMMALTGDATVEPLVVVDGAPVREGLRSLASIVTCDVDSVRLLRSIDAFKFYGAGAAAGAIDVRTRTGMGRGHGC
jgi:hypothetical protein